jgi:hypothetical protein
MNKHGLAGVKAQVANRLKCWRVMAKFTPSQLGQSTSDEIGLSVPMLTILPCSVPLKAVLYILSKMLSEGYA